MEGIIKEFAKIHVILFKTLSREVLGYRDYKKTYSEVMYSRDTTFGEMLNVYKSINQNKIINEMVLNMEDKIRPIECLKFNIRDVRNYSALECELQAIFLREVLMIIKGDVSIKIASDLSGISETAIKQACQQGRLLNSYKIAKNWVVNLVEIKEYWECDIDI